MLQDVSHLYCCVRLRVGEGQLVDHYDAAVSREKNITIAEDAFYMDRSRQAQSFFLRH